MAVNLRQHHDLIAALRSAGAGVRSADILAALIAYGTEREKAEEGAMDQLLRAAGVAAPFLVLGAMVAIVVLGRWRGVAGRGVPHRFWFGALGSGWRQGDGAPPLPPDPLRPLDDDRSG